MCPQCNPDSSGLADSFSPGQTLGFLPGECGEQHLYQVTFLPPAQRSEGPCTGAVPKAEPLEAETHTPPPPMPGPKQPTAQVPFAFIPSPAIPAGGISEFTKPTQPLLLLPFGFGFGFGFGQAAGPGERGHQVQSVSASAQLSGFHGLPGATFRSLPSAPALLSAHP